MIRKIAKIFLIIGTPLFLFVFTFALQGGSWYFAPLGEWRGSRDWNSTLLMDRERLIVNRVRGDASGANPKSGPLPVTDIRTGASVFDIPISGGLYQTDGKRLVVALDSDRSKITVYDLETSRGGKSVKVTGPLAKYAPPPNGVLDSSMQQRFFNRTALSKSADTFYFNGDDQTWYGIDIRTGESRIALKTGPTRTCRCNDGEHVIATDLERKTLECWSLSTGKQKWKHDLPEERVLRMQGDANGGAFWIWFRRHNRIHGKTYVSDLNECIYRVSDGELLLRADCPDGIYSPNPTTEKEYLGTVRGVMPSLSVNERLICFLTIANDSQTQKSGTRISYAGADGAKEGRSFFLPPKLSAFNAYQLRVVNEKMICMHSYATDGPRKPPAWFGKIPKSLKKFASRILNYFDSSRNYTVFFFDPTDPERSPTVLSQTSSSNTSPFVSDDGTVLVTMDYREDGITYRSFSLPLSNHWPTRAAIAAIPPLLLLLVGFIWTRRQKKRVAPADADSVVKASG